jgi:hypothetical protein
MVVDRALAFEAADRYPDAATMQGDVRALREGGTPPYASQSNAPRSAQPGTVASMAAVASAPTVASTPAVVAAALPNPTVVSRAAPAATPSDAQAAQSQPRAPSQRRVLASVEDMLRRVPRTWLIGVASLTLGVLLTLVIGKCMREPTRDQVAPSSSTSRSAPSASDDRQKDLEKQWKDMEQRK